MRVPNTDLYDDLDVDTSDPDLIYPEGSVDGPESRTDREINLPPEMANEMRALTQLPYEVGFALITNDPAVYPSGDQYVSEMVITDVGDQTENNVDDDVGRMLEKFEASSNASVYHCHSHPIGGLLHPNVTEADLHQPSDGDLQEAYEPGKEWHNDNPGHWNMIASPELGGNGVNFNIFGYADHDVNVANWSDRREGSWRNIGNQVVDKLSEIGYNEPEITPELARNSQFQSWNDF